MRKILLLTAEKTGTGHKSAANAIEKKLSLLGYDVKQMDCFPLMGKKGIRFENSYIPTTLKHPYIWKLGYVLSQIFSNLLHCIIYNWSKKALLNEIWDYQPDLIISVHGLFTKAVSKLLKKNNLNIPFMINVIDLVNPPKVWRDKRATISFVATDKVKQQYLKLGFKEQQLIVSGFPIREDIKRLTDPKKLGDKVNILLVNPSVKLNKNLNFVKEVSRLHNANITFVCGRDEKLHNRLKQEQKNGKIPSEIQIYGFITNMNKLLNESHILLTKAGPNMLLEGTRAGCAVVVTGHIPGQEEKNYEYITQNEYGIKCENPKKIYSLLSNLLSTGQIDKFLHNTTNSTCNDGATIIASTIQNFFENKKANLK